MKALVVYDSKFGNTQQVAEAIGEELEAQVLPVQAYEKSALSEIDLLVVGSPTHAGRPTAEIEGLIKDLGWDMGVTVACFDTRIPQDAVGAWLKLLISVIGYAAPKMEQMVQRRKLEVMGVEGFLVESQEGPLRDGELERARDWSNQLLHDYSVRLAV